MSDTLETLRGALRDSHIVMGDEELRDLARRIERQERDEPPAITVYTELLQALATWSARVDEGDITHNDFVDLQQIEPRIISGYREGRYTGDSYHALITIYNHVKEGARSVLGLY